MEREFGLYLQRHRADGRQSLYKLLPGCPILALALIFALICLLALGCSNREGAGTTSTSGATTTSLTTTSSSSTSTISLPSSTTQVSQSTTTTRLSNTTTGPGGSRISVATPNGVVTLTPRQLAGQRVIYSYSGLTPPAALLSLISRGEVAGVIFFGENISSREQIRTVIAGLEKANKNSTNPIRAPLLLMTDQEGGEVRRLPGEPLLSEKQIGKSADPAAQAAKAGSAAAANLKGVGMNVNLAPVLDVYRVAGDFSDMFGRSYSKDPAVVSSLGAAFIRAQQEGGVAAAAKHFPGLGAAGTSQNTDAGPVVLEVSRDSLRAVDELPYRTAIKAGVDLVMLSWAVYPALDPNRPAGFSSTVVKGELRDRLGFQGVTVTDALEAASLKAFGTTQQRALLAAQAGMDLLLCAARDAQQGQQATDALARAYLDTTLEPLDSQEAAERVVALRFSLGD